MSKGSKLSENESKLLVGIMDLYFSLENQIEKNKKLEKDFDKHKEDSKKYSVAYDIVNLIQISLDKNTRNLEAHVNKIKSIITVIYGEGMFDILSQDEKFKKRFSDVST